MDPNEFNRGVIRPVECFREGWDLIKGQYWILFAASILGVMIGGVSLYILLGAMVCGMFLCFIRVIDGEKAEVESLFKGFSYFWPSLLVMIVIIVPLAIVIGAVYLPLLYSTMMGVRMTEDELIAMLTGTLLVEFIFAVGMVCLHTLLMFSFPLIVDRNLSGWRSMVISAKAVLANLGGVTGLWALGFVAALVGYLALCFGIYFVIPIILAGNTVAYRKVFPRLPETGAAFGEQGANL